MFQLSCSNSRILRKYFTALVRKNQFVYFFSSVAAELKRGKTVNPEFFSEVTIFFSDIVGFTKLASSCSPLQVCCNMNVLYRCQITDVYIYKVRDDERSFPKLFFTCERIIFIVLPQKKGSFQCSTFIDKFPCFSSQLSIPFLSHRRRLTFHEVWAPVLTPVE